MCVNAKTNFENCNIHISGKNDTKINSVVFSQCTMTNSYISGKCPANEGLMVSCKNNIYNISVPNGDIYAVNSGTNMKTVINDSIIDATYTTSNIFNEYLIKATEEQMYDAEYLKSQGFIVCG